MIMNNPREVDVNELIEFFHKLEDVFPREVKRMIKEMRRMRMFKKNVVMKSKYFPYIQWKTTDVQFLNNNI